MRIIFCLCVGIALLVDKSFPSFVLVTPGQWLKDYMLFSFAVVGAGIIVEIRHLRPWRKQVKAVVS
ncbi:MAG: hypothetical protein JO215_16065 [Ktedonobacteraceae bacterium]|nr:hypothetical protein [Ktedonobacteraceae bacterium]